jgi:hypothetical protein
VARLGVLNGWPPFEPSVPAVDWWIAALQAGAVSSRLLVHPTLLGPAEVVVGFSRAGIVLPAVAAAVGARQVGWLDAVLRRRGHRRAGPPAGRWPVTAPARTWISPTTRAGSRTCSADRAHPSG